MDLIITMKNSTVSRRSAIAGVLATTALAWTGCSLIAPEADSERRAQRRRALEQVGFAESADGWGLNLSGRLLFGSDESSLAPDGAETVAQVSRALLGVGIDHVTVEGHSDNLG